MLYLPIIPLTLVAYELMIADSVRQTVDFIYVEVLNINLRFQVNLHIGQTTGYWIYWL